MARLDFTKKEDVEKLQARIRRVFNRLSGGLGDADECAQEILLGMLEGRHQHQTVDQAVIDYLRSQFGRKGEPSYIGRQNLARAHHVEPGELDRLLPVDSRRGVDDGVDFKRMLRGLESIDKACFKLFYGWGLSEVEISDLFDVSASRISQRIERVSKRVRQRVAQEKSRAREGKMESLLRAQEGHGLECKAGRGMADEKSLCVESFDAASF